MSVKDLETSQERTFEEVLEDAIQAVANAAQQLSDNAQENYGAGHFIVEEADMIALREELATWKAATEAWLNNLKETSLASKEAYWLGKNVKQTASWQNESNHLIGRTGTVKEVFTDEKNNIQCKMEGPGLGIQPSSWWCPASLLEVIK